MSVWIWQGIAYGVAGGMIQYVLCILKDIKEEIAKLREELKRLH